MSIKDPKTKGKHDSTGNTGTHEKSGYQQADQQDKKKKAFDEGMSNNSNTQTGTAHSGYDEKNPKHPGGKQQQGPKVTNDENTITNSQEQNKVDEEPVDERSGNSAERTDPEIDSPIPDAEKTEKKIPTMKGGAL
ncbi:hypothetical protein D3H65_32185 [Paraflavitalea soli]|uniref:Uncharacterized protein n=1 Tax=Paraflavitalea soli TaxID=2315862 RepID=A0A3B7MWA2_9BACT|nr:hypothetical protein [Paraflavitalea soli]AXY78368.1 hypothetical protein D3H65_32185 [Paraflavitalea soli]